MTIDIDAAIREFPIFSELKKSEISGVRRLMTGVQLDVGTALMVEGERSREAALIVDGTADVTVGDELVATVGPGEFVGELGVIAGISRTATVTVTSPMTAQILTRSEFNALLDHQPEIARKLLTAAVARLVELDGIRC